MLQSFGNDAGFILEISVISNRQDKKASAIYFEFGPGQTTTDWSFFQHAIPWRSQSKPNPLEGVLYKYAILSKQHEFLVTLAL